MKNEEFQVVLLEKMRCMAVETPEKRLLGDAEHMRGLSAAEVWDLTGRVYAHLKSLGVGREDFVLVRLPRGIQPYVVMVGVWRAGAACIVIEEEEAPERTEFIRCDCAAKLVADRAFYEAAMRTAPRDGLEPVAPHDAAFAVYTSGTTGSPKGALHEYGQLNRIAASHTPPSYRGRPQQMFGYIGLLNFIGTELMFTLWVSNGVGHHVVPREIVRNPSAFDAYCAEAGIDCAFLPPSYVRLAGDRLHHLRSVVVGSEPIDGLVSDWMQFINFYAMSESAFVVMTMVFEPGEVCTSGGRPELQLDLRVLDEDGHPVPQGELGEICYDNPFLRGYIGRPEETEKAFRFGLYHTGDLGRFDANGELFVSGRMTDMVKINGNRVEPGEIEGVARRLLKNENVSCRVVSNGDTHLICLYYIGAGEIDSERIRAEMARYLPYYMIPAAFVRMDAFPKTRTGKIDRKALPAPDLRSDVAIVPPSTDFEKKAFPVVAAELGTEDFGVLTNLVSLGLTSLRAIRLSCALEQATGHTVSVSDMLAHPRLCDWEAFAGEATLRIAGLAANAATVPLSANQLGLYIDWTKAPHGLQYNLPFALRFDGVSGEALREAVGKVVKAHPVLTAHIEDREGSIVLVRRDGVELPISFETLDREPDAAFFQSRVRPFDLLKDDLARFEVYAAPKAAFLFLDVHHIVFDGGSMNVLLKDVVACLKGGEPAAEQASSFDVAVYGQDWLASSEARSSEAYFDNLVAGTESFLYPSARNGAASSGKAETKSIRVPLAPIQAKCRELGVTENAFFATALCEVFRRVSRIDDIQVATVSNGRSLAQLQNTVGMFVQTLPLVSRKAKGPAVEAICAMQDEIVETLRNDRYPFAKLVERHGLKPNVLYAYQGDVIETENLSDARAIPLSLDTAKVPLTLNVTPKGEAYDLVFEYDAGLYGADEIETLAQAFAGLTASLAALPDDASLAQATLVDEASARDLLALGTGEKLPYDRSETFVDQFLRSVAAWPDATAVVAANGTLTYRELDERSDALAAKLVAQGVKCEEFVAIKMGRVKEFLVAVLGIWKAGGAYLPLGAEYPEERIRFMLEDSEATVIVDEAFLEKVAKIGGGGQWNDSSTFNLQPSTFNLAKPSGLAYMIYTSGSTGKPKGTMLEHGNLRAFNEWLVRSGEIGFGDAIAVHSSFSFDGSCLDLYPALTVGGTVHILSKEVREDMMALDAYFRANRIKGGFLTARLAGEMLVNFDLSLHYLMAGGEKVVPFKPTKVRVMNAYGPTECTILSTCGLIDQTFPSDNLPLGRPVPNTFAAIVDTAGNLLPRGMAGELCLCGPQIARGYWKRQELTAEKFLPSPFYPGERMYRTGDLCTWNDRDELVCLGRIDNQVKLRGFRIEMGEIETAMVKMHGIASAVAAVKTVNGTKHLVGYYVSTGRVDESELRVELVKSLADYMVPEVFVRLETMPLTPNGKVDRKALPEPEIKAGEIVAPETDGEKALFAVVAAELKTEQFGVTTNLISMGLTSIRAIRLSAAIKKATGLVVSTGDILAKPRIRDWASLGAAETETIAVLPPQETYPLTANQLGVYLDWVRNRTGLQYNVPLVLRFADLDAMKLREAVAKAVATHPYFKVHLEDRDGTVVQVRRDKEALDVLFEKLNREPDAAFFQSRVRPFDLLRDDLARFEIYVAPKAAYMFSDVHHILFDGGAVDVFLSAVRCALAGGEPAAEQASAYDYALHDAVWQSSKAAAKAAAHFDGLVAGTESFLYPPLRGDAVATGKSATCSEYVPLAAIRGKCRELGVTENAFFATALCEVFRRVSRIDDIQIATVSNGRSLAQLQNTVGMFVETLPLVSRKAKGTAVEAIRAMQDQIATTLANDRYPFAKLVERHGLKPNVLYVYQGDVVEFADDAAVTNLPLALDTVKFPLSLDVTPKGEDYEIAFEYDAGLYGEDEIRMLAKGIASFAGNIAAAPVESSLSSVPLVSAEDAAALIALGSGEKLDYDRTETLVDLFRRKAKENLTATAVVSANGTLTYAELDARSDVLAAALVAKGVKRDDFVVVKLGRVKEFPLAILAIWKAGAAYVPVDPEYPEDRIRFMIEDSGARVVVDEVEVEKLGGGGQWNDSSLSTSTCNLNLPPSTSNLNLARPEGLAYMIYTSGSTGLPKGVMVTHANLLAFTMWALKVTEAKPGDALAHFSSFSFDASLDDLVAMFGSGATLHILDEATRRDMTAFHDYLVKHRIAVMDLPAAYAMTLLNTFDDVPLRCLSTGGEKLLPTRYLPKRFINGYGPTEFTVCSSIHDVNPTEDGDDIPIGRPVPNTLSAIVDADGNLLPRGMVGELVLAGAQLTKGYWRRPELTAERFVALPWLSTSTSNLNLSYRTGDLARWNEAGELLYCGRIDNQVKLRGFRIELGEIETAMAKFPNIASAVADVKKANGLERLVGYYVATGAIDETALRAALSEALTDYMVPDVFVRLERIPMTPAGKVDRKALPMPEITAGEIVAPETDVEKRLFDVVAAELKTTDFGVTTNLITLGLSSLRAIRLSAVIRRDTGLVVSTGDILAKPRIRDWARATGEDETILVLPPRETYPLTANQLGIYVDWERDRSGLQYNVVTVLRFGNVDAEKLRDAVAKAVAAHPSLKVRFEERDGEIVQVRRDGAGLPIRLERLEAAPDAAFFTGMIRPFDLLKDGLARFAVYGHGGDAWLFCDIHHTIFDGSSSDVLLTAICEALAGRSPKVEQVTAFDYALFLADWQRSNGHDDSMRHYRELLSGTESFKYPSRRGDAAPSGRAAHRVFRVARPEIRSRCRALGVTENAFFATVFCQVFHRAGRTDVVQIATISGGRSRTQLAETVGMFVQTLPLVSRAPKGPVADVLKKMHDQIAATLRNDLVSFAELSSEFHLEPDVMYVYQDGVEGGNAALSAGVDPVEVFVADALQRGLTVGVSPAGGEYEVHLDFDAGLYGEEEMSALEHAVAAFALNLASASDAADVSSVPLVTDLEARELVSLGTGERIDYDDSETFLELFRRQVRERPEATAVIASNGTFTYGELDATSDTLAAALAEKGVKPGDFVAVKLGRTREFPAAALAAWKVGAAYVPVDPAAAPDRISYMLEDSGTKVVVDENEVEKLGGSGQWNGSTFSINHQPSTFNLARPSGLAYMIYTSGSTGKPKGVMISHRALRAFIAWRSRLTGSKPGDCDGINASFSFDASMDIYATLSSGACAYVFDDILKPDLDRILAQVREHNIRVMGMNTSLGVAFLDNYDVPLDLLTLGGEALTPFRPCRTRVANCYGPTEFTVASVIGIVDQSFPDGTNISIGRPVPNSLAAVVDAFGNLVPRGMTGELCSAGVQIAEGYWKRPDLTAEKFVALPWLSTSTSDLNLSYRTGDLACWNAHGELLYLGRMDAQVKFRGYRIELGEIEANMQSFSGIREAAVCVKRVGAADRLCGYYVAGEAIDESTLATALAKSLPDYMVPECFVRLGAMPRNLSGKVDHRALPLPVLATEEVVAPETDFEKRAFEVVSAELGNANFGVTTNLISLGLTSIRAIRVSVALRKATGREIRIGDILSIPRIRDWDAARGGSEEIPVLPPRETYPLMPNQVGILASWRRNPTRLQYNLPTALRLEGVDAERLRDAVAKAVAAHPYLKVRFEERGGAVVQVRRDEAELPILFGRLVSEPDAAFFQSRVRPFDLFKDDLARFEVYGFGADAYLFYDVHHIVFDGGSVNVFQTDVLRAYAGEAIKSERVTAYDYALAQAQWRNTPECAAATRYFDDLVKGTEPLFYPPARTGATPTGEPGELTVEMPRTAVAARCRELGVTENAFLATALAETLRRLLRTDDIQIATSANGRSLTQLAGAVGMFVQTLPLVSRRTDGTLAEAVREMQAQIAASVSRDRCPQPEPERGVNAGARLVYEYQGGLLDFPEHGPRMSNVPLSLDTAKGPLYVDVFPNGETYVIMFEFDAGLYGEDEIRTLQRTFCEVTVDFAS